MSNNKINNRLKTFILPTGTAVLLILFSCQTKTNSNTESIENAKLEYGMTILETKSYQVKDLFLDSLQINTDSLITVRGKIQEICKIKGCWIDIVDLENSEYTLFVQFPEDSFTLPLSAKNEEVLLIGKLSREIISVEDLVYEAERMDKTDKEISAIVSPKEKLSFIAEGVKIQR